MKKILENASELLRRFQEVLPEHEKTQHHLSPRQQMVLHQMPKRQAYLKTQKRLEVMDGFLKNMQTMLDESIEQMSTYQYPVERLQWLAAKGLPTLRSKLQQEHDELQQRINEEFLRPKKS